MSLSQGYQGKLRYRARILSGPYQLLVAVDGVVAETERALGLLDTAAEWCVLPPEIGALLGYPAASCGPPAQLSTRLGTFVGTLERIPIRFPAAEAEDLTVEATWFISSDWPGPVVLGWSGCLERFRFGLDPIEEAFYFREP